MFNLLRRARNLWQLGGIQIDGFEYDTQRKQVINKITDVFLPSKKENIKHINEYNSKVNRKMAQIIRMTDPVKEVLKTDD